MHTGSRRTRSAVATAVAVDSRALLTVGLVSLLGLVLLISAGVVWPPAT